VNKFKIHKLTINIKNFIIFNYMRYIKKAIKYSWAIPLIFASILFTDICHAQMAPPSKRVVIDTVIVTGTQFLSPDLIAINTNILPGEKIDIERGNEISNAIRTLWDQGIFDDIKVEIFNEKSNSLSLNFIIKERPKMSSYSFRGVNKTQEKEIKDKLILGRERMVTKDLKTRINKAVNEYFAKKGYLDAKAIISEEKDTKEKNAVRLIIDVQKGKKVRINEVLIAGNNNVDDLRLKSKMRGTKEKPILTLHPNKTKSVYQTEKDKNSNIWKNFNFLHPSKVLDAIDPYFKWNIFASAKFDEKKFREDKQNIISYYNSLGYRDAQIVSDTVYRTESNSINVELLVEEGQKYYFGNIDFAGNTKYADSTLRKILNVEKGDVYNMEKLKAKLGQAPSFDGELDIGTLYMDDGYLFFEVEAEEKAIYQDTIDIVVKLREGPQATIRKVSITGNDRTNEHVLRRELYTLPGNKFSRSDIIASVRMISSLGYIDPEQVQPEFEPQIQDGTVDINYGIVEKSNDQLELSAGFGGGVGFMGTVGVVFNNFSVKNILNKKAYRPLPMGDGQNLAIRYQSNGLWYNSGNITFSEPWLGGKKPIGLSVNLTYGRQSYSEQGWYAGNPNDHYLRNFGGGVMISKRLRWPDQNFVLSAGINYQNYFLKDYTYFVSDFIDGPANNLYGRITLGRKSLDQEIFPRSGSNINFTFQFTPPYSSLDKSRDVNSETVEQKYKWIEYHKYRFNAEWYQRIYGNLILKLAVKYGFLGYYNSDLGHSPFERFNVGGDGLSGFNMFVGRDLISQRGYDVYAPDATIFNKYTAEIRYPFSLNPSATIFGLAFFEAGNGWNSFKEYNPMSLYRAAGLGIRIHLPMFGLLGLDYGIGIDRLGEGVKFSNAAKFTFMLGFEPD